MSTITPPPTTAAAGQSAATGLFSRDFDTLEGGEGFVTRGRTITEADIVSFAGVTGDFHPQHVDAEWAKRGPFGERVAHGMLTLSIAVGLVPLDPERVVALRRIEDAVFKRPARIGDTVRVEGRVESLREVDDELGLVRCVWRVAGADGALLARVNVEVLWRRGASPPPGPERSVGDGEAVGAGGPSLPVPDPSCGLPL